MTFFAALNYLIYFVVAMVLFGAGTIAYVLLTPVDEFHEIRDHENRAAAWALGGFMIGFAAVIYTVTAHGARWYELVWWAAVAFVVQVSLMEALYNFFGFKRDMQQGQEAAGIFLGLCSIAVGLVNAGCLT